MIQIVGYRAWREAKRRNPENGNVIQLDDVTRALPASRRRFEARVIEPARAGLSERSLAHLETIAGLTGSDGAARSSEVAESVGGTARSLFPAWARLLGLDLVESPPAATCSGLSCRTCGSACWIELRRSRDPSFTLCLLTLNKLSIF